MKNRYLRPKRYTLKKQLSEVLLLLYDSLENGGISNEYYYDEEDRILNKFADIAKNRVINDSIYFPNKLGGISKSHTNEYNYHICEKCDGAAKLPTLVECRRCNGNGFIIKKIGETSLRCERCRGKGKISKSIKCDKCNGTGVVDNDQPK